MAAAAEVVFHPEGPRETLSGFKLAENYDGVATSAAREEDRQ